MARSPLKGVEAILNKHQPLIRALIYGLIFLSALVNLALLAHAWTSTQFMRQSGTFTGAVGISSCLATMVVSGLFIISSLMERKAQVRKWPVPKLCQKLQGKGDGKRSLELSIGFAMTAWWMAVGMIVSNTAYIFRTEIKQGTVRKLPKSRIPHGISIGEVAMACAEYKGSLVLCWLIFVLWIGRTWRAFTRNKTHFNSNIFRESSALEDLNAIKLDVGHSLNPATFSPHHPAFTNNSTTQTDDANSSIQSVGNIPVCACLGCPMAYNRHHSQPLTDVASHASAAEENNNNGDIQQQMSMKLKPTSVACRQKPTVGTAELVTEPLPNNSAYQQNSTMGSSSERLRQWTQEQLPKP